MVEIKINMYHLEMEGIKLFWVKQSTEIIITTYVLYKTK